MAPDDIINENDGEQEEEQEEEQVENIIDLNNYGMKPYSWRYEGEGGGGGSFDPDITDPQDGDTLVYNATQQKWVNGAGSSGGGVLILHEDENGTLDKTWKEIRDALSTMCVLIYRAYFVDDANYYEYSYIQSLVNNNGEYSVNTVDSSTYSASSETDYPVFQ